MRSYCIYDGKKIDIAEIYHVIDGMQINIPEKVEMYRELGRNNQLFCPCGCGNNVVIVAGPKRLRRQHFRLKSDFQKPKCTFAEESQLSINSKIVLKCWLEKSIHSANKEILYRVPISQVSESKRAYELSIYSPELDVGIIYARKDSNVVNEKISLIAEHVYTKILYVNDQINEETEGQYPEYMYRFQKIQGFCFYLEMEEETPYNEVIGKVSVYAKDYKGLWQWIPVCYGYLDDYEIDSDGKLICMGTAVMEAVSERLSEFKTEQAEKAEQARKEKEEAEKREQDRLRQQEELKKKWEKKRQEAEEERKKRKEEEQKSKLAEIEQERQTEREEKEREEQEYAKNYPKLLTLYEYLTQVKMIFGYFDSDQTDGTVRQYPIRCDIKGVKINKARHYIEVAETSHKKILFFVIEKGYCDARKPGSGVPYAMLNYSEVEDIVVDFTERYKCVKGNEMTGCSAPDIRCPHMNDDMICLHGGCCTYQKSLL